MGRPDKDFKARIYEVINDKAFISNISGQLVDVVEELPEKVVDREALFDGIRVYDRIEGMEDDIQRMTTFTKDRMMVNVEDYYRENGAFEDDGMDHFVAALERLMTMKEFARFLRID